MVGGPTPGLVVLGSRRKQAEQIMRSELVSSTPPRPLHQHLPPGSCPVGVPPVLTFFLMDGDVEELLKQTLFPPKLL